MAAPAMGPKPEMTLTTPGGKILAINWQAKRAERGVCSAVLMTMVFPHARAGAIFHANMRMGKFPVWIGEEHQVEQKKKSVLVFTKAADDTLHAMALETRCKGIEWEERRREKEEKR